MDDYRERIPKYPQCEVRLSGVNGNVFVIIGKTARALRNEIGPKAEQEYIEATDLCRSYDEVLQLTMRTVDVV